MKIMIVKSSPWTICEFESSLHPEFIAIRNIVRRFRFSFILVGIGGPAYQRFRHPKLNLIFYNIATANTLMSLLSYPAMIALVVATRPGIAITMGLYAQIPVQIGADLVRSRHVSVLIGEPFYATRRGRLFHKLGNLLLRLALKRTDAMMAISQKLKQDILKIVGRIGRDIDVYRYRIADIFRPGLEGSLKLLKGLHRSVVLTSCRIERRKGLELVILASAIVLRKISEVTFVIRGPISDPRYFRELAAMIQKKGLSGRVMLIGETRNYSELPGIVSSADVFLHPSLDESLGLAIAEALACGVPVVATRVGGITELVEHMVNGILVERDSISIANAIVRILSDTDLRNHLREGAAKFSEYIRQPKDSDFGRMLEAKIEELLPSEQEILTHSGPNWHRRLPTGNTRHQ